MQDSAQGVRSTTLPLQKQIDMIQVNVTSLTQVIVIPGLKNKLGAFAVRLTPQVW